MQSPEQSKITLFVKSNRIYLQFLVLFPIFFLILQGITYTVYSQIFPFVVETAHVDVATSIINVLDSGVHAVSKGNAITCKGWSITVARGCDGIDGIIIILSALLAFPMGFYRKIGGVSLGLLIMYCANLFRIVALFFILGYWPEMFDQSHLYGGQAFIIFVGSIFFLFWISNHGNSRRKQA